MILWYRVGAFHPYSEPVSYTHLPVKGMMVELHADLSDSAFVKKPFDRVSRTDSRGRFTIRGIAPVSYTHLKGIYGLGIQMVH